MTLTRHETKWGHAYKLDGKAVKGVTTLLNKGLPKPAIAPWAARTLAEYVADNPDQIEQLRTMGRGPMVAALKGVPWQARDEAAIRGTDVHALGERLVHGEEVEVPEHLEGHVEGYVKWLDTWQPEPIWTERPVASRKWWYAGTFDLIATMDGQTWLLDLKTASGVYGDNALQLAAYAHAEFLIHHDVEIPLPPIDRLGVIHITASGTELYPVKPDDMEPAWKDFLHTAWIGKAEQRIKNYFTEPQHEPEGISA